jgi:PAS domain S-box-containing protein
MEIVGSLFLLLGVASLWLTGRSDRYGWWTLMLCAELAGPFRHLLDAPGTATEQASIGLHQQAWMPALLLATGLISGIAWVAGVVNWALRVERVVGLLGLGLAAGAGCWFAGLGPPVWVIAVVAVLCDGAAIAGALLTGVRGLLLVGILGDALVDGLEVVVGFQPGAIPGLVLAFGHVAVRVILVLAILVHELALRREILDQLVRSEEHFRMIFEHSGVAMALLTPQGGFVRANPALCQLFGYTAEELQGRTLIDLTGNEHLKTSRTEQGMDLPDGVYERERHFRRKDGQPVVARVLRVPLRDASGVVRFLVGVVIDVTEQRRAEAALGASEARYRLRFEGASDGLFTCTPQGHLRDANPAFYRLTGLEPRDLAAHNLEELADDPRLLRQHLSRTLQLGDDRMELRLRMADGDYRDVEIASSVLPQDGQPVLYASVRDIHERKRTEETLRQAEEKLRQERDFWTQVVGTSAALILVLDRQGRLVRGNDAARDLLQPGTVMLPEGLPLEALFPEPLATTMRGHLAQLNRQPGMEAFEAALPCREGIDRWIAWRVSPTRDPRQPGLVVLTGVDVTDERRLEEQLRQSQKMECLGTLVGGIAHDFNNQLAIVLGNLELLMQEARVPMDRGGTRNDTEGERGGTRSLNGTRRELHDAEQAARRCAEMTQSLLAFSRRRVVQLRRMSPAALLGELAPLLQRVLPATIQVDIEAPPTWYVQADNTQLHQVLMNLAINARDAMPEGGQLRITLANRTLQPADVQSMPAASIGLHQHARPGQFVVLTVSDNGFGMTPEVKARVFEPFFTTKEVGKGTGLGLPVVFGIVQAHGGWIYLYSEVDRGTMFEIWLPALANEAGPEVFNLPPVADWSAPAMRGGNESILLVDDEEMLRGLGRSILERWGYRVLTACNGEEALESLQQYGDTIGLVLLDLTMPGMTGLQLLPLLRHVVAGLPVIFSSGHGDAEGLIRAGANAFLPKPYRPDELVRLVRRVLDARL